MTCALWRDALDEISYNKSSSYIKLHSSWNLTIAHESRFQGTWDYVPTGLGGIADHMKTACNGIASSNVTFRPVFTPCFLTSSFCLLPSIQSLPTLFSQCFPNCPRMIVLFVARNVSAVVVWFVTKSPSIRQICYLKK